MAQNINIKEVLHLYLGCEMIDIHQIPNRKELLTAELLSVALMSNNRFYKPILRPLSDMSEEEGYEWDNKLWDFNFPNGKGGYTAEQFRYLLSKHFDLFGLIEAGLAIYKTTLKIK